MDFEGVLLLTVQVSIGMLDPQECDLHLAVVFLEVKELREWVTTPLQFKISPFFIHLQDHD